MRTNILLKTQRSLSYSLIAIAIILFILSLGFMTNFYELFYNGTTEMLSFYKELQFLNKAIFNAAVIFIVIILFSLAFEINKKSAGIFGLIYVIGITVYILMTSRTLLSAIPYYRDKYLMFDFSIMEKYNPSTFTFSLSTILFIILSIFSFIWLLVVIINYIRDKKTQVLGGSNETI